MRIKFDWKKKHSKKMKLKKKIKPFQIKQIRIKRICIKFNILKNLWEIKLKNNNFIKF